MGLLTLRSTISHRSRRGCTRERARGPCLRGKCPGHALTHTRCSSRCSTRMSSRFYIPAHGWSTQTVPEKVHALQFTQKLMYFPYLSRSLSVFFRSLFSRVSIMHIAFNALSGIAPNFSYSNSAANIHFLQCRRLANLAQHSLESTVSTISCDFYRVLQPN